jgi:hypothetical protein
MSSLNKPCDRIDVKVILSIGSYWKRRSGEFGLEIVDDDESATLLVESGVAVGTGTVLVADGVAVGTGTVLVADGVAVGTRLVGFIGGAS